MSSCSSLESQPLPASGFAPTAAVVGLRVGLSEGGADAPTVGQPQRCPSGRLAAVNPVKFVDRSSVERFDEPRERGTRRAQRRLAGVERGDLCFGYVERSERIAIWLCSC